MRSFARLLVGTACLAFLPAIASAQTSAIAGTVRDTSGAVLPGVTVEVASPALIERTRSSVTDGSGQYKVDALRPGVYSVTFTLPGFNTVKRDNVELTSDFTATINSEMKVGAVEETITVSAESPVVDVQNITTRTVMTRDVLDAIPTGRNIQAIGIMIPGTSISLGGGGALSRDVGGSGNLQQSPLQYRGSADTVQTVEGMRLNNLCANGAYSGVYWNDGSFQEISYVTGADSAEMGQGGMRVNMVPKDGGNSFHGTVFGNWAPKSWSSDNCDSPGTGQFCQRKELAGDLTSNPNNKLSNVSRIEKIFDFNPGIGGPIAKDRVWFYGTFRYWGVNKTVVGSYYNASSVPFRYVEDTSRPGIDDGHIRSVAGRVSAQLSSKDKISYYHDDQNKVRGHWGISASILPEASAIQATPTSFVSVSKYTRTHTNRLLFDAGFAVYDQEYQENYQPEVLSANPPQVTLLDSSTNRTYAAWNSPADHFSKLFTEQFAASYITGSHSIRVGATISQAKWRLVQQYTRDVQPVTFNGLLPDGNLNITSLTLRIPTDRRNSIRGDSGFFAQDKWTYKRATINAGVRWDWFISAVDAASLPAGTFNAATEFPECPDGKNNLAQGCVGRVTNWKDINPRLGVAYDLFGTGRTAVKVSVARYVNGVGLAGASTTDNNNPQNTIGLSDTRAWRDADGNGSPFDGAGNVQLNELTPSVNTANFGRNVPTTQVTNPDLLEGWHVRGYNWEYTVSGQHELMPRVSVSAGWYRRKFGNQTITVDQRYSMANGSYDGPFCVNAPSNPNLPNGGGYQVCGLYDLKPSVVAQNLPPSSLLTFSDDVGGETNIYTGFDASVTARPKPGVFFNVGINAQKRIFDQCGMVEYGVLSLLTAAANAATPEVTEIFPDGSRACHQDLPYRPDFKFSGSYTLPLDILFSGTFQFSRGVQNGGAAPSILAQWATTAATTTLGRAFAAGAATRTWNLMPVGENYGNVNLKQLDLRASKRVRMGQIRVRVDFDAYNVLNNNWPFTVTNTFSTAATSQWLRPTNVLQARFYKVGLNFDF
jgi:hypothetical protein